MSEPTPTNGRWQRVRNWATLLALPACALLLWKAAGKIFIIAGLPERAEKNDLRVDRVERVADVLQVQVTSLSKTVDDGFRRVDVAFDGIQKSLSGISLKLDDVGDLVLLLRATTTFDDRRDASANSVTEDLDKRIRLIEISEAQEHGKPK